MALLVAVLARFDFALSEVDPAGLALFMPVAALIQGPVGLAAGLYRGRWRYGSFDEMAALARAVAVTACAIAGLDLLFPGSRPVPLSAPLAGGFVALVLMAAVRYGWRLMLDRRRRPSAESSTALLVFGAGEGGWQVLNAMLHDPASPYYPVGLLDDDPTKRNLRIMGVPVVGARHHVAQAAARLGAEALLIAIPSADNELVNELNDLGRQAGLQVKVLPAVRDLFGGGVGVGDIRDIEPCDLLGRHHIETDLASIAGYLTGARVLVTGAGGSIGSELCRQISRFAPAELIMLDRDESALHAVQLSIRGRALLDTEDLVLADIRDIQRLTELFEERRPQVVFHAAALKHLTLLEMNPGEAVKSNVWGTLAVLRAASAAGVERFVNISTDKAADPASVLGFTKRIGERLTAHADTEADGTYLSVRFGNVLGSRGSVLSCFQAQVEGGGPVTVTDPDVTRYFMTVEEASELVIQAGAIGRDGEVLVLDMGDPVRIDDVARRFIGQASYPIDIEYTGLRPGEKLHEALLGEGELDQRPIHPLISHVAVPALDPEAVWDLDPWLEPAKLKVQLEGCCRADHDREPAQGSRRR